VSKQNEVQPGYYTIAGQFEETECDLGTYQPLPAQGSCVTCRVGFYCDDYAISTEILHCPAGYYCVISSQEPAQCPEGTFNNQEN